MEPLPVPSRPGQKLCACGRSKALPFCDNSHEAEGWSCVTGSTWARTGFCASYRYQNLARKLASRFRGAFCWPGEPVSVVDRLVTIVDGLDLELPLAVHRAVRARTRIVVTLGVAGGLLQGAFAESQIIDLGGADLFEAYKRIEDLVDRDGEPPAVSPPRALHTGFLSHAVKDEPALLPALDYLRRFFQADLFVCADSILPGTDWLDRIWSALAEKQRFVAFLSQASLASQFCSFEIGAAHGLGKPIRLLSLDGSLPPAFVQRLQVVDLPRLLRQRPWLDLQDVLVDELLRALSE